MKIFLSWSGEQSKAYANALRDWIPLVVHFVEPWVSDADIEAGERWALEVGKELETSNFGLICINRENIGSQWLLFEAGALSRSMQEGRVIPLLFDIEFKDISGPLAQFQAKKFDQKGVWDIVSAINKLGEPQIPDNRLRQLFDALWPDLEKAVEAIPKTVKSAKTSRPQHEVLEELVSSVRGLDARLREVADFSGENRPQKSKYNRIMQREMISMLDVEPNDPLRLLMVTSGFRDDFPWLYELASEIYRQENAGNRIKSSQARAQLSHAIRYLPASRVFDDKFSYELFRELEHWVHSRGHHVSDGQRRIRTKPAKAEDPTDNSESEKK